MKSSVLVPGGQMDENFTMALDNQRNKWETIYPEIKVEQLNLKKF